MADIDSYQLPHESDDEWSLRRAFIVAHRDRFSHNRLLCLASCFINAECYGCRYSPPVMKILNELTAGLRELAKHRSDTHERIANSITFVPAQNFQSSSNKPLGGDANQQHLKPVKFVPAVISKSDSKSAPLTPAKCTGTPATERTAPNIKLHTADMASQFSSDKSGIGYNSSQTAPKHSPETFGTGCQSSTSLRESDEKKIESRFYALASQMKESANKVTTNNDAELMQIALSKSKMFADTKFKDKQFGGFCCDLLVDCVLVASADSSNKKLTKHLAYSRAVELLRQPYLKVEKPKGNNGTPKLVGSDTPFHDVENLSTSLMQVDLNPVQLGVSSLSKSSNVKSLAAKPIEPKPFSKPTRNTKMLPFTQQCRKRKLADADGDTGDFVILKTSATASAINTLHQSADANKKELLFEFCKTGNGCKVLLAGQLLADAVGDTDKTAKTAAAEQALKRLSASCYTIVSKLPQDALPDDAMKREEVFSSKQHSASIPESNIGSKLLKKMGWVGGGVGKEGNRGIEEPVSLDGVVRRAGLGCHSQDVNFSSAIARVVKDYLQSARYDDLIFSPEFTADERAAIHTEARKHHLRTRSYGSGDQRYLTLSLHRTPRQLVEFIKQSGGETAKYILQPPTIQHLNK